MDISPSPFDRVASTASVLRTDKESLVRQVRELEERSLAGEVAAACACLQDGRFLTESTMQVYAALQQRGARVRLLGRGLQTSLPHGLRGVDLSDDDPLGDEWLIVMTGTEPVCLAARDLPADDGSDAERTFEYAVTRDPGAVQEVLSLLAAYG